MNMPMHCAGRFIVAFDRGFQLGAGDAALVDLGGADQEIHHLIFIQRRAQLHSGHGVFLEELHNLLLLGRGIAGRFLPDQAVHFGLRHGDAVALADFGQQQAQTHTAHGNAAIILTLGLDLGLGALGITVTRRFGFQGFPNLLEFGFYHRFRHIEIMARCQRVEQLALEIGARQAAQLRIQLIFQNFLECVQAIKAKALGKLIVQRRLGWNFHAGHGHMKLRILAREIGSAIITRERHVQHALLIEGRADQLVFKTRDQLAGADLDPHGFALAAIKRHAGNLAFKINHHSVAGGGFVAFWRRFAALRRIGKPRQRAVHGGVISRHHQFFQRKIIGLHVGDRRQHFDIHGETRIAIIGQFAIDIHGRLRGRAQAMLADHLIDAVIQRRLQRFTAQGSAVHFLDEIWRHLAGTKAGHLDGLGHFSQTRFNPGGDGIGRNQQRISAAQALVGDFGNLHRKTRLPVKIE